MKKKKKASPSTANNAISMALALHVVDFESEEEAVPLEVYDPNVCDSSEKSLRRSTRFTTNKYRSASPELNFGKELHALPSSGSGTPQIQLRRSPRFISTKIEDKRLNMRENENGFLEGSKKRPRYDESKSALSGSQNRSSFKKLKVCFGDKEFDGKCLRRSPRLNKSLRKRSLGEKYLRKSPRLNPTWAGDKNRKLNSELLQLLDSAALKRTSSDKYSVVSEKQLRSRPVEMHVRKDKAKLVEIDSEKRKLGNVGEKFLRSRKLDFKLTDASNERGLRESTSAGSDIRNVAEKCLSSRKIELKLLDASPESAVRESNSAGGDISNVAEKCLRSGKMDSELPYALEESITEKNIFEENDINVGESCLPSQKLNLELPGESSVENCESHMLAEKCLRSRKIAFRIVADENVGKKLALINGGISKKAESEIKSRKSNKKVNKKESVSYFIGEPIPEEEARKNWHWRYELKSCRRKHESWILNAGEEDEITLNVQFHYAQANIDGCVFNIGDCALIKGEGTNDHIGRILEFFKTMDGEDHFRVQWFFRAEDTVMKQVASFQDKRRIFYSTLKNDNPLDCIISKVNVLHIPPSAGVKRETLPPANFYYDMEYCVEYSTFRTFQTDSTFESHVSPSDQSVDPSYQPVTATPLEVFTGCASPKAELALLDLYSGCGGMSTGLCLGARLSSINLVTRWAVDFEKAACDSLKLNHPETQVRNESAEDFLELLKRWEKLCKRYIFNDLEKLEIRSDDVEECASKENNVLDDEDASGEFEVSSLVDICYGDPNERGKCKLHFKVRWKGYGPDEDTWEPMEGLSNCPERIQDFVRNGLRCKILPRPGDVDVICGGPPCQGISGYNRYRNADAPLTDDKNHQIVVFMDIVKFLKPKYVLMENVSDILRFDGASLARYALSRLVHMKYQASLGTVASGCYGLPQFRLRVFIWAALPSERLPPFPLPTHDVVVKYWPPPEFERNTVAYDEGQPRKLEDALFLHDAISDLPAVTNQETREEMEYIMPPDTEFQKYIRLTKEEMMGLTSIRYAEKKAQVLYDHRPYPLSKDNYERVCQVPHKKGANFRDLPGVVVGEDNVVRRVKEPALLPSGQPIVPDCCLTYEKGKSRRPFARLWWDETVSTVLTFPYLLSQAILHPEQDRVLTIRECARLQGFPDFYQFCGTVKERYCQVGNAVSVPVGRALGYALGMAYQKLSGDEPLLTLPPNFSFHRPLNDEIVVLGN